MPTISQSSVAVTAVLLPKNSKMVLQYSSAFSASNAPISMATIPMATSRFMSTAPTNDNPMALATKRVNGTSGLSV